VTANEGAAFSILDGGWMGGMSGQMERRRKKKVDVGGQLNLTSALIG
jgi:hypothetical protein